MPTPRNTNPVTSLRRFDDVGENTLIPVAAGREPEQLRLYNDCRAVWYG